MPTPAATTATSQPTIVTGPGTVTVYIRFDARPADTTWGILTSTGAPVFVANAGTYGPFDTELTMQFNLVPGERHRFFVFDEGGNGLCCDAYAAVYLGDTIDDTKTLAFVEAGVFRNAATRFFVVDDADTFRLTFSPTAVPTQSTMPSASPAPTVTKANVTVSFNFDENPHEVGFAILDAVSQQLILGADPGEFQTSQRQSLVNETFLLDLGTLYTFLVYDLGLDGSIGDPTENYAALYLGDEVNDDNLLAFIPAGYGNFANQNFAQVNFTVSDDSTITLSPTSSPTEFETTFISIVINFDLLPPQTGLSIGETRSRVPIADFPIQSYGFEFQGGTKTERVELPVDREYIMVLLDEVGDGMCCNFGQGNVTVYLGEDTTSDDAVILAFDDGQFGSVRGTTFFVPRQVDDTLAPSTAPAPQGCSVCGEGLAVTAPAAILDFGGGNTIPCGQLEQLGAQGLLGAQDCAFLPGNIPDCQCMAVETTEPGPTSAPSFTPCSVCGEGLSVTAPTAVLSAGGGNTIPCGQLEQLGAQGLLGAQDCAFLPGNIPMCECAPDSTVAPITSTPATESPVTGTPTTNPTASPVATTPQPTIAATAPPTVPVVTSAPMTPAPVTPVPTPLSFPTSTPITVPFPSCSLCGPGMRVGDPDAIVMFPEGPITCLDAELLGFDGRLSPVTCMSLIGAGIDSVCGCISTSSDSSAPVGPTPDPTPLVLTMEPAVTPSPTNEEKKKGKKGKKSKKIKSKDDKRKRRALR